jgi:hypothetical protein
LLRFDAIEVSLRLQIGFVAMLFGTTKTEKEAATTRQSLPELRRASDCVELLPVLDRNVRLAARGRSHRVPFDNSRLIDKSYGLLLYAA